MLSFELFCKLERYASFRDYKMIFEDHSAFFKRTDGEVSSEVRLNETRRLKRKSLMTVFVDTVAFERHRQTQKYVERGALSIFAETSFPQIAM